MSPTLAWTLLVVAGVFEVGWAIGLKHTEGFSRLWPSIGTLACMAVSFFLLARAMQVLPVGTSYAVWTGIGAVGTAVLGIWLLGESGSWPRVAGIALIVAGIVTLKIAS